MTKISQYTEISLPTVDDLLIGTDVENQNKTKNFSIQGIVDLIPKYLVQLKGTQYSYVACNGTELENGEEFEAAYVKASLLNPTALEPFTIIVGPGAIMLFDIFEFNKPYLNVVSLTGLADVVFTNGIVITADNIYLKGIDGGQINPVEVTSDLNSLVCDTMVGIGASFITLSRLCGHYINCIGGDSSFSGINVYGSFENCTGGEYSFFAQNYKNIPDNYYASFNNCKLTIGDYNYDETLRLYNCIDGNGELVNYPLQSEYELIANKSTDVEADKLSDIKYPSVKAVYDRWGLVENIRFTTDGYLDNFFAGRNAGINNTQLSPTQGTFNTFVGSSAGRNNTTGYAKTNLGYNAGYNETVANGNLNLGYQAGFGNIAGNYNTNVGTDAGARNKGSNNCFFGWHSGFGFSVFATGVNNNFFGYETGLNLTSGFGNNFFGARSGYNVSSGYNNSCLGDLSGFSITSGISNALFGRDAGFSLTIGSSNCFFGQRSGYYATSSNNSAIGDTSLFSLTSGANNAALGASAGFGNTTGSNNVFMGNGSGLTIANKLTSATILNNSIMIGSNTSPFADNQTNQVVVGYNATGLGSNTTVFGNSSTILTAIYGQIAFGTTSVVASAQVQIDSSTKGFLPPRMTNAQRIAIATPAVGLCVYCTDATEGLYVNKSTGWTLLL